MGNNRKEYGETWMWEMLKSKNFRKTVVERPTAIPIPVARMTHFKTLIKRTDSSTRLFSSTLLSLPLSVFP
jgi:hypothetical protein